MPNITEHLQAVPVISPMRLTPFYRLTTRLPRLDTDTPLTLTAMVRVDAPGRGVWELLNSYGRHRGYVKEPWSHGPKTKVGLVGAMLEQMPEFDPPQSLYILTRLPEPVSNGNEQDKADRDFLNSVLEIPAGAPCLSPYQIRKVGSDEPARMAWAVDGFLSWHRQVEWFPDLTDPCEPQADW